MNHAIHTAVRRARHARIATSTALGSGALNAAPSLLVSALVLALSALSALPAQAAGIDATINSITAPAAVWVGKVVFFKIPLFGAQLPLVVLWLVVCAVYFTWYMKFVNLRGFRHAIELARGDYADPKSAGEVSHFQALATAVSGTVGIGNIGGVAVAVTVGGAGATFWLILAGFLGMSTKFVECTLGVKYRNENPDGSVSGGPMYYLRKGFEDRGMSQFGKYIGGFYSVGIFVAPAILAAVDLVFNLPTGAQEHRFLRMRFAHLAAELEMSDVKQRTVDYVRQEMTKLYAGEPPAYRVLLYVCTNLIDARRSNCKPRLKISRWHRLTMNFWRWNSFEPPGIKTTNS